MPSDFAIVIDKKQVKHFWKGRGGFLPIAIVERMIQGSIEDAELFFDGRKPEGVYAVSAHYGIARDGRVWQFVDDEDTAWSNGVLQDPDLSVGWLKEVYQEKVNCNLVTLSIDYEGFSGEPLTPEQYQAALALHRQLVQRWEIETDDQHIIGHSWIDSLERSHNPGPAFPFEQLLKDLQASPATFPVDTAFVDMPLPATEAEAPMPEIVQAETLSHYQPETVEEPAYRPQVDAVTFAPGRNYEMNPVTAEPLEVEPATAEPEEVETGLSQPAEPAWQIPDDLKLNEQSENELAATGVEEPDYLADLLSTQALEEPSESPVTLSPEEAPADFAVEASSHEAEAPEVPAAIDDQITPKQGPAAFTDTGQITPAEQVSMAEVFAAEDEKASQPDDRPSAPDREEATVQAEPENQVVEEAAAQQAASQAPVETKPALEPGNSAAKFKAAAPVPEVAAASENQVKPEVPVKEAASPAATAPAKSQEKHHWYDKLKALFVKNEEPDYAAPVETASASEKAEPDTGTGPEEARLDTGARQVEADINSGREIEEAQPETGAGETQLDTGVEEVQAESVAAPEVTQAEPDAAVEATQVETGAEEVQAESTLEPEEVQAESTLEPEEVQAASIIGAEEVQAEPAMVSEAIQDAPDTAPETTEAEPAIEAQATRAEPVFEVAAKQPEVHEPPSRPVQPVPQEESFYPFELDTPPVSNHAAFYHSAASNEPAVEADKFNFDSVSPAASFEEDYGFQDLNGPSDYPFELPTLGVSPQPVQPPAGPSVPPTLELAVEKPAQFEEVSALPKLNPAPAEKLPTNFPTFEAGSAVPSQLESREDPAGLPGATTAATGPHGFAYDDLELPAWLDEPEGLPEAPAGSIESGPVISQDKPAPTPLQPRTSPAWGSNLFDQENALPGWLQKPIEPVPPISPTPPVPAQAAPEATEPLPVSNSPGFKDAPAVALPNNDWQDENLFEDDDFFSLLNQPDLDLGMGTAATTPAMAEPTFEAGPLEPGAEEASHFEQSRSEAGAGQPPDWAGTAPSQPDQPEPDFPNFFDELEPPPARQTIRQLIDRNDGYTAPLSYEDLDLSVPFDLEEASPPAPERKPLVPARDGSEGPEPGKDSFDKKPSPGMEPPPPPVQDAPSTRRDPAGFNRVDLGGGAVSVELANIRSEPSYAKETIIKIAEHGQRFEFDGWSEGPELRNSTRWYHFAQVDGEGWIHSTLVTLDRPFAFRA